MTVVFCTPGNYQHLNRKSAEDLTRSTLLSLISAKLTGFVPSCAFKTFGVALVLWAVTIVAAEDSIEKSAKSVLTQKCISCHSGDAPKGKLDLTRRDGLISGGESGSGFDAGAPLKSNLWQRVERDEMPPKHPLSPEEKQVIKGWIEAGAVWNGGPLDPLAATSAHRAGLDWWSLQPLRTVRIPLVNSLHHRRQPIDDFVAEKLVTHDLQMSPEADRRVLLRRISYDLTGLPPSPEEVDRFVTDDRPDAFERVVDRLLASLHYGERWARHWLDVVRFGESHGFERDLPRPNAWPYRDWVITALNRDLPYDEFARWQLAGDLLAPDDIEAVKAVGFLVAGPHDTVVPVVDKMRAMMRQDELEDIVGTVGQTFLGLTVNCARCHDHKFDPITAREYYQLASALSGIDHGERELSAQSSPQPAASTAAPVKIYSAIATQPGAMKIHQRGNVTSLGEEVVPAGLAAVGGLNPWFNLRPDAIESHRRKALTNWITDRRNSLFVRVMTNRVWHYHFGSGLVESPNDLGFHAGLPSHPDLLEWLSAEFLGSESGVSPANGHAAQLRPAAFSLKRLHRLVVTSATYRQSSSARPDASRLDAGNRLLWRMNPHRLEAESLRDSMLAIAGVLNTELGGKGYSDFHSHFFKGTQFYDPIDATGHVNYRRTVYRMWARGGRNPFLDTFDCPDPSTTTPRRSATVTPLQALSLLNNSFSLRMADHFANRLLTEEPNSTDDQIVRAYRLMFGRAPDPDELAMSREFISRRGLPGFCRAMWSLSEFLLIE